MVHENLVLNIGGGKKEDQILFLSPDAVEFEANSYRETKKKIKEYPVGKGIVEIIGGEPTHNSKILELIELAKDSGHIVSIETDCRNFSDMKKAQNFVDKGMERVSTELHGTKNIHNSIIGEEVFEETIKGIENLVELGVDVSVSTIFHVKNIDYFDELAEKLIYIGVSEWVLNGLSPTDFGIERYKELAVPHYEVFDTLKDISKYFDDFEVVKIVNFPECVTPFGDYNLINISYFESLDIFGSTTTEEPVKNKFCKLCNFSENCKGFMKSNIDIFGEESIEKLWKKRKLN